MNMWWNCLVVGSFVGSACRSTKRQQPSIQNVNQNFPSLKAIRVAGECKYNGTLHVVAESDVVNGCF